eukprot:1161321-Pelagomonas_calceolata.AAC.1
MRHNPRSGGASSTDCVSTCRVWYGQMQCRATYIQTAQCRATGKHTEQCRATHTYRALHPCMASSCAFHKALSFQGCLMHTKASSRTS